MVCSSVGSFAMVARHVFFLILFISWFPIKVLAAKSQQGYLPKLKTAKERTEKLVQLKNVCIESKLPSDPFWGFTICFEKNIVQHHTVNGAIVKQHSLGTYKKVGSPPDVQIYQEHVETCGENEKKRRHTKVHLECCHFDAKLMGYSKQYAIFDPADPKESKSHRRIITNPSATYVEKVTENAQCSYVITICSELVCENKQPLDIKAMVSVAEVEKSDNRKVQRIYSPRFDVPTVEEQEDLLERVRAAFYHGYDSYLRHGFPHGELKPMTCGGGQFEPIKLPLVTLIDTLDTLVIMGNYSEFRRAVAVVSELITDFDYDVSVSVFETTIRILGGLLSAHLFAIDPALAIYPRDKSSSSSMNKNEELANGIRSDDTIYGTDFDQAPYDGNLLTLAIDLGDRLMPAFETKTKIPYGTVNLRRGVPRGETKIASTAGAGSLFIEFEVLSQLSGDPSYGDSAREAMIGLFQRRSTIGLLGKHINTETGLWHESLSGIGSNADSFYEYLLKSHLLFRSDDSYRMFTDTYRAIKQHVMIDNWFTEVDMFTGKLQRRRVENLGAFWPGMEAQLGFTQNSAAQLNSYYAVWSDVGFLPEELDFAQWQLGKGVQSTYYPLRPELIESTYTHYRTSGDRSWLAAGRSFLESLEQHTRTDCGYAAVHNVLTKELQDVMPSFFLSETCKYLYLLFDENNFVHSRPYIFSTEAHPFDPLQLRLNDMRPGRGPHFHTYNVSSVKLAKSTVLYSAEAKGSAVIRGHSAEHFLNAEKKLTESSSSGVAGTVPANDAANNEESDRSLASILLSKFNKFKRKLEWSSVSGNYGVDRSQSIKDKLKGGDLKDESAASSASADNIDPSQKDTSASYKEATNQNAEVEDDEDEEDEEDIDTPLLPAHCQRRLWWDRTTSYKTDFLEDSTRAIRLAAATSADGSKDSKRMTKVPPPSNAPSNENGFPPLLQQFVKKVANNILPSGSDNGPASSRTVERWENVQARKASRSITTSTPVVVDNNELGYRTPLSAEWGASMARREKARLKNVRSLLLLMFKLAKIDASVRLATADSTTALITTLGRQAHTQLDENAIPRINQKKQKRHMVPSSDTSTPTASSSSAVGRSRFDTTKDILQLVHFLRKMGRHPETCDITEAPVTPVVQPGVTARQINGGAPSKLAGSEESKLTKQQRNRLERAQRNGFNSPGTPQKSVELAMENLGVFNIDIYQDGFLIHNQWDGNTLEISNVGKSQVLVREKVGHRSTNRDRGTADVDVHTSNVLQSDMSAVIADMMSGFSTQCRVSASLKSDTDFSDGTASSRSRCRLQQECRYTRVEGGIGCSGVNDMCSICNIYTSDVEYLHSHCRASDLHDMEFEKWDLFDSPCTVASFIPARSSKLTSRVELPATQKERQLCTPLSKQLEQARQKRWWPWNSQYDRIQRGSKKRESSSSSSSSAWPSIYDGSIVLGERGKCLFEEKLEVAREDGAGGLIVVNNEDSIFIMAGKTDQNPAFVSENDAPTAQPAAAASTSETYIASAADKQKEPLAQVADSSATRAAAVPLARRIVPIGKKKNKEEENPEEETSEQSSVDSAVELENAQQESVSMLRNTAGGGEIKEEEEEGGKRPSVVPTVMISQSDGQDLFDLVRDYSSDDLLVDISIDSTMMVLNNEFLGDKIYPKVWMRPNLVIVAGHGTWGAILTASVENEAEWQLYLVDKKEISNPLYLEVLDQVKRPVTIGTHILRNPVELYWYFLSRKCPNVLKVVDVPEQGLGRVLMLL